MFNNDCKDLGQYRRFIELCIDNKNLKLFNNATDAEKAERVAVECRGIGLYLYVNYIMKETNETYDSIDWVKDKYNSIKDKIDTRLRKEEQVNNLRGLVASSQRFALIIVSYEILYEMLYNNETSKNNSQSKDIENILVDNLINKYSRISSISNLKGSIENIINYVQSHANNFKEVASINSENKAQLIDSEGKILGIYTLSNNEFNMFLDSRYRIAQFLYMNKIPETDVINRFIQDINDKGYSGNDSLSHGNINYGTYKVSSKSDYRQQDESNTTPKGLKCKFDVVTNIERKSRKGKAKS
jgi:hypothetical protein